MWPIRRKRPITPGAVILLPVALALAHERILPATGDFLIVEDDLHPADLFHVPGGGTNTRLDYAAQLYRPGYGQQLFAAGGRSWETNEADCLPEDYLICRGVTIQPPCHSRMH